VVIERAAATPAVPESLNTEAIALAVITDPASNPPELKSPYPNVPALLNTATELDDVITEPA
jgi:hypothetical protein